MDTEVITSSVGLHELITLLSMVAVFCGGAFFLRLPIGLAMAIGALTGTVVGGVVFPLDNLLRHLVEGMFAYFDPILIIATATIFMFVIDRNGMLRTLARWVIVTFYRMPFILLGAVTLIIMFPGMLTGSATVGVLTTGALMAPVLMHMGIPRDLTGAIIAMAALFGLAAPPVNIPALIIGAGVDLPYVGLELPLLVMILPLALGTTWALGLKYCKKVDFEMIRGDLPPSVYDKHGIKLYAPLLVVLALLIGERVAPNVINLGLPLTFMIGALTGIFTGEKINFFEVSQEAMRTAMPILGILMGVGMFIQVMTLTGARGEIVIQALQVPRGWFGLYPIIGTTMPLMGAVSSFGSASVLGVPFILALPTSSPEIVVNAAALSLIVSLGDLMPPTALAGLFAAQVVGEPKYVRVLRWCILPGIVTAIVGLLFIQFAGPIGNVLVGFGSGGSPY